MSPLTEQTPQCLCVSISTFPWVGWGELNRLCNFKVLERSLKSNCLRLSLMRTSLRPVLSNKTKQNKTGRKGKITLKFSNWSYIFPKKQTKKTIDRGNSCRKINFVLQWRSVWTFTMASRKPAFVTNHTEPTRIVFIASQLWSEVVVFVYEHHENVYWYENNKMMQSVGPKRAGRSDKQGTLQFDHRLVTFPAVGSAALATKRRWIFDLQNPQR